MKRFVKNRVVSYEPENQLEEDAITLLDEAYVCDEKGFYLSRNVDTLVM